ncbi:MAG: coenzyme F420 biosynthesis-associated protein [Propionibacteriales bacterium]|nr:coenzyme F420 biosynthesis-associated protein [Propionibacteriales bacterium]
MVDWELAAQTAKRFLRPGPEVSHADARTIVTELRAGAEQSEGHVRAFTGLHTATATAPVVVIDRGGWVQANTDGFRMLMRPVVDKVVSSRGTPSPMAAAVGSRITGLEVGALLGYLAGRVLGQFDPFWQGRPGHDDNATGRMLLVAPNIVHTERELDVDPHDFRLWVCLHEETHRVQFTAVPWMREHLMTEIGALVDATELDPAALGATLREGVERLTRATKGELGSEFSLLDLVQTPAQREIVDRITATMSLLEGHADVVMDGVGPDVIPSVEVIRKKFDSRRKGGGALDQLLRRLLGFDAKMRQYRDGAAFVRGAVDAVGMDGFNQVWASPDNLPSKLEIGDPAAWVRRVHG